MLNILKRKQNILKNKVLTINSTKNKQNIEMTSKLNKEEYIYTIYYPSSTKEWFNSIYSYNKSFIKSLIIKHNILNNLL